MERTNRSPMRWFAPTLVAVLLSACASSKPADTSGGGGQLGVSVPSQLARPDGSPDPDKLIGLDAQQVTSLLGPADFRRADGPAEILQYRAQGCLLNVFLYRDAGPEDYRVQHVEARGPQLSKVSPDACIVDVMQSRRA